MNLSYRRLLYALIVLGVLAGLFLCGLLRHSQEGYACSSREVIPSVTHSSKRLLFVGHIYPKNDIVSPPKPLWPNRERPLDYIRSNVQRDPPERLIFGGDSVWLATRASLEYLRHVKKTIPQARFLLGNHEDYWAGRKRYPNLFKEVFGQPYWSEDVDGVRLIFLHTVSERGQIELDLNQQRFLKEKLKPEDYRYALLFMHHALWAGDAESTNMPYPNATHLKATWNKSILPLLIHGNVRAVFSGDGGWRQPGRRELSSGIPHFITGWPGSRPQGFPEWLSIALLKETVSVTWKRLTEKQICSKTND